MQSAFPYRPKYLLICDLSMMVDPLGAIIGAIQLAQLLKTTITTFVEAEHIERALVIQLHLNASTLHRFVTMFRLVEESGLSKDDQIIIAEASELLVPEIQSMKDTCAKIHQRDSRGGRLILKAAWVTYRRRQIEALRDRMWQWSETFNDFYDTLPENIKARLKSSDPEGTPKSNTDYMRNLSSVFGSLAMSATTRSWTRLRKEASDVEIVGTLGALRSANFEGTKVLLEYKLYRKGEDAERVAYIADQIGRLANFLEMADPITTGVLECVGWIEVPEMSRFGLLFKMPLGCGTFPNNANEANNQGGLATLHSIISDGSPAISDPTRRQYAPKHALNERVSAASTIATALYYLHSYNWVHEGLRSSNVLMLANDDHGEGGYDSSNPQHLGRPFLLGFDGARSNEGSISIGGVEPIGMDEKRFVENLYRHPDRQGESAGDRLRYQMCHDQYSLGVILLEIGLWIPLEKEPSLRALRRQPLETSRETHLAVRRALTRLAETKLEVTFGRRYQTVVLSCLRVESSASYDLSRFLYDVVEPLSSMNLCLSDV